MNAEIIRDAKYQDTRPFQHGGNAPTFIILARGYKNVETSATRIGERNKPMNPAIVEARAQAKLEKEAILAIERLKKREAREKQLAAEKILRAKISRQRQQEAKARKEALGAPEGCLTLRATALKLKCSTDFLGQYMKKGRITGTRQGRFLYLNTKEVQEFIALRAKERSETKRRVAKELWQKRFGS